MKTLATAVTALSMYSALPIITAHAADPAGASNGTITGYAPGWVWSGAEDYEDPSAPGRRAHALGPNGYGSYSFTGTGIEVYGTTGATIDIDGHRHRLGSIRILIDGKPMITTSVHASSTERDVPLGHVTGLSQAIHVLEIRSEGGWAAIDYIRVLDPSHPGDTSPTAKPHRQATASNLGTPVVMMNVGGPTVGDWAADSGAYGGTVAESNDQIDLSGIAEPAPEAVYQSERWGPCGFVFPGLAAGAEYNIRLDFAETYYTMPRVRLFDIAVNNEVVMRDVDIFALAGGKDRAFSVVLHASADSRGQISVAFLKGKADNPVICGIAIYKP